MRFLFFVSLSVTVHVHVAYCAMSAFQPIYTWQMSPNAVKVCSQGDHILFSMMESVSDMCCDATLLSLSADRAPSWFQTDGWVLEGSWHASS